MTTWQLESIDIGVLIPWCYHQYGVGRIVRIEYSAIYSAYRITCSCDKRYQISITGRYVEGG